MNPKRSFLLLLLVTVLQTPRLQAQGAPITGTARITGVPDGASAAVGGTVVFRVAVNCGGVTGTSGAGTVPAVLGAYQISVTFDKALVRFDSAAGGSSAGFTGAPTATNASTANSTGKVTITGAQTSSTSPTGNVSVATLTFSALAPGSAAFSTAGVSLSSAFVPPSYGPVAIPSTPGNAVLNVSAMPGSIANPSPGNNSTSVLQPVTLSWTASANTTSYDVYFGTTTPQFLVNTTSTSVSVPTQPGTTYRWRVVSKNAVGSASSDTFRFTTRGDAPCLTPGTTHVSAPSTASSGTPFLLTWSRADNASTYRVEESDDPSFVVSTATSVDGAERQLSITRQVTATTTFYYRVVPRNESGGCDLAGQPSTAVAVIVEAPVPEPAKSQLRIIPAVMSGSGSGGSFFRTALQLHNSADVRSAGLLRFHPAGAAGTDDDPSMPFILEPGQTLYYADVVNAIGSQGLGSLDVVTEGEAPRAVVRVLNDAGEEGTTGMFEPMLREEDALKAGDVATLITPPDPVTMRYNIGVRTLEATTATLELRNNTGATLTSVVRSWPATWFEQRSAADLLGIAPGSSDTIVIRIESGRAFVYGAATDNRTHDPSLELARP